MINDYISYCWFTYIVFTNWKFYHRWGQAWHFSFITFMLVLFLCVLIVICIAFLSFFFGFYFFTYILSFSYSFSCFLCFFPFVTRLYPYMFTSIFFLFRLLCKLARKGTKFLACHYHMKILNIFPIMILLVND